jgi:hypothetical protein
MRKTFRWFPHPDLELHEADILAELPALSGWAPAADSPLVEEVVDQLPALAGLQESRA